MKLAFVDTETTGLEDSEHQVWEAALILRDTDIGGEDCEHHWFLSGIDIGRADHVALEIGRFHERYPLSTGRQGEVVTSPSLFVEEFEMLTVGCVWVGANPSFDQRFIRRLFDLYGARQHWHYRPICIEDLVYAVLVQAGERVPVPWKSEDIFNRPGMPDFDQRVKHTALGDARQVCDLWDWVHADKQRTGVRATPTIPAKPFTTQNFECDPRPLPRSIEKVPVTSGAV